MTDHSQESEVRFGRLSRYTWTLVGAWTAVLCLSLAFYLREEALEIEGIARVQAETAFEKDVVYREWNAGQGGVYAPVTEETPPNPYLRVEDRDVVTQTGKRLTLINPAYMTRQAHEIGLERGGVIAHITSLDPIRPANKPDAWEEWALRELEHGVPEVAERMEFAGGEYMRVMRPLITQPACLACHAEQGYEVGEIRGGISTSVPMAPLWGIYRRHAAVAGLSHTVVWALGLIGILLGSRGLRREVRARDQARADLLEANRALEQARNDAEESRDRALEGARAKEQFLANISHEIRTPLNGVVGMTELLLRGELTPRQREYAEMAQGSANVLMSLVSQVLDFSKIEAGRLELEHVPFDPTAVVEEVVDMVASDAQRKGLEFILNVSPALPPRLEGDPARLRQILLNLTSNAVKFTPEGSVTLSAQLDKVDTADDTPGTVTVVFSVMDTGVGISAERQAVLFEPFTQADPSTTREFGGTGLGLTIAHQLAQAMGGEIKFHSEPGKGSRFWFALRFAVAEDGAGPPVQEDRPLSGKSVLIVDDTQVNRDIIEATLRQEGCQVVQAASAEDGLEQVQAAASRGSVYDVILVDYQMPRVDGLEFGQRALSLLEEAGTKMVLVSSSHLSEEAGAAMQQAGFTLFLMKPLKPSRLVSALTGLLAGSGPLSTGQDTAVTESVEMDEKAPEHHPVPGLCALIVEDNAVNQKVAECFMNELGFDCDIAANGEVCLQMLQSGHYDVVLMDCNMPVMDGFEATRQYRRRESEDQHLPIVAMTALAMKGDEERCLESGMDAYVPKPVRVSDLRNVLARFVPLPGAASEGGEKPPEPGEDQAHIELEQLHQFTRANPALEKRLFVAFLRDSRNLLETAKQAAVAKDYSALRDLMHALKGSAGNMGLPIINTCAGRIESMATVQDPALDEGCLEELYAELDWLDDYVERTYQPGAASPEAGTE